MILICKKLLKYYDIDNQVSPERLQLLIAERAVEPIFEWKSCLFHDHDVCYVEQLVEADDIPAGVNCCYIHLRNGDNFIIDVKWDDFIAFIKPLNPMIHEFKSQSKKVNPLAKKPVNNQVDFDSDLYDNLTT